jgi:hypothetical protein
MDSRTLAIRRTLCRSCICAADFADPCATCPKGRWHRVPACESPPASSPLPSLVSMARTAVAAAAAETKAILQGGAPLADAEVERRLSICAAPCEHYIAAANRCRACGCFLRFKTALRTGKCPAGKW